MPRTHTRKAGARIYTVIPHNVLQKAFEEYQNGSSQRAVCSKHSITRSRLQNFIQEQKGNRVHRLPGHPTVLSAEVELSIVQHLLTVSEWGFPFDNMDLRMTVKRLLDKEGTNVHMFKDNVPGEDWVLSFLSRHKDRIKNRLCQNIAKKRASVTVSPNTIRDYFHELTKTLEGVPPENIINYDATNLTDDPGRRRFIFKRGVRYPERILNSSKSSTSLMLAGAASGTILPVYTVYKADNLWNTWTEGGPKGARFNRSKSGWFDNVCFVDWFQSIALPYCRKMNGKRVDEEQEFLAESDSSSESGNGPEDDTEYQTTEPQRNVFELFQL